MKVEDIQANFNKKHDISSNIVNKIFNGLKVNKDTQCWEWQRGQTQGYGEITFNSKPHLVHRLIWQIFNGPIPDHDSYHGLCVLHKCDNPKCSNPDHLFLGTAGDNNRDRAQKERGIKGEQHKLSKLNKEDIQLIRKSSLSSRQVAKIINVSPTLIKNIRLFKTWKHIK